MQSSKKQQYDYEVSLVRVVDGDTIVVSIDLGFGISWQTSLRLFGFDTPERGEAGHDEAIVALKALLPPKFLVTTVKDADKYGRYLASIPGVAESMIRDGWAVPYSGGKKMPAAEAEKVRALAQQLVARR